MSDFFTPPPPPPREPEPSPLQPEWLGPRDNELGEAVAVRVVLARTADVAVAVNDVVAYSNGIELGLAVRMRTTDQWADPYGMHYGHTRAGRAELTEEVLRFGVEFGDGRRATNIGGFPHGEPAPSEPVLVQRGGGGGGRTWDMRMWLWPLPPPGALVLVCEWPKHAIELTRVEVDAQPLLDAAARSEQLWPGGEPSSGGGFVSSQMSG